MERYIQICKICGNGTFQRVCPDCSRRGLDKEPEVALALGTIADEVQKRLGVPKILRKEPLSLEQAMERKAETAMDEEAAPLHVQASAGFRLYCNETVAQMAFDLAARWGVRMR